MRSLAKVILPIVCSLTFAACQSGPASPVPAGADTLFKRQTDSTTQLTLIKTPKQAPKGYRDNPPIIASIKQVLTHIPEGYEIIDTCSGDLNLDTITDFLILLRQYDEDSLAHRNAGILTRRLLILTGTGDSYRLAAQSDSIVKCVICGGRRGDPYKAMSIKKGSFTITQLGGSNHAWTRSTTFRYSPKEYTWYLSKNVSGSYRGHDLVKPSLQDRTKKDVQIIPFSAFSVYDGQ
ncbi:hypothetical protein [Paraflavitalea sp. CAU 1676]|uniref:hypothetical protein n=1 Tax=Paraflavitalea sp. CAU 1676 TaxID=3032598 RepID=UPI0023D9D565|nr:hypothetical protein [Paraflavitalea sp. CAU 1676]MDF2192869.1 hypothetical protein [Paraflavitalea sp. CAU 1676]